MPTIDDKTLLAVIDSALADIRKADPGEQPPADATPPGSSVDSAPPADASAGAGGPPSDDAPPPGAGDAPPADASAGDQGGPPTDPMQDAAGSPEQLQAEYAKFPLEELKIHVMAAVAALNAMEGAGDAPPADASAGDQGGPPPAAPGPDASVTKSLKKAEENLTKANGEVASLRKSVSDLTSENEALRKSVTEKNQAIAKYEETIEKFGQNLSRLQTVMARPMRKSAASLAEVDAAVRAESTKVEVASLSKSEVSARLAKAARDPSLTSADRQLINDVVMGHKPAAAAEKFLTA